MTRVSLMARASSAASARRYEAPARRLIVPESRAYVEPLTHRFTQVAVENRVRVTNNLSVDKWEPVEVETPDGFESVGEILLRVRRG